MWYMEIEGKVFSRLKYNLTTKEEAPYPDMHCTTKNANVLPDTFPTLYLHELTPIEAGNDLNNETVNAVLETIEIQVFSNQSETEARQIMGMAIDEMKKMRFNVIAFPDIQMNTSVSIAIARFRRMIGNGDEL